MTRYAALDRHVPSLAPYLAWWLDGLRLGRRVRGPGRAPRLRAGQAGQPPRQPAALEVPRQDWLTLSLPLPPVPRAAQAGIVKLAVADRTPFDPETLYLGWTAGGAVHLVRRAAVAETVARIEAAGGRLHWLVPEGQSEAFIDLAPRRERPLRAATSLLALVLLALVSLGLYLALDVAELRRDRAVAEAALAPAQADAAAARALAGEIDALRAAENARLPAALLPDRAPVHALLDRLTAATPDHSYLTALEITEAGAILTGWSMEPETLMRSLAEQDGLANPRFRGPVVSVDGGFRFEIRLDWEAPA